MSTPALNTFRGVLIATTLWLNAALGADCIYPSSAVVNGVILRTEATTASAPLATLRPGEKLPWVDTVAAWYQTRTPSGQTAFVSKRWTDSAACDADAAPTVTAGIPVPLLTTGHPVDWWFVFKLNAAKFPGCENNAQRQCPFGGTAQSYTVGQQFVYASSEDPKLKKGANCLGATLEDPVGSTFDSAFTGEYNYVVWNDQFKGDPSFPRCSEDCPSPWGHSKGMVVWNREGAGFVMQVTTPSWPGAGNQDHPRHSDGNTLGCTLGNNVKFSQHFFALKVTKEDLTQVLRALHNASVGTDPTNLQIVKNGGPADIQNLVSQLGRKSNSTTVTLESLSTGVQLVSKPSKLHVPPWQMVSALLGSIPLRTATWWATPTIPSTSASTPLGCWSSTLPAPGAVDIATSGQWNSQPIGLKGFTADGNHAKIGVSTDATSAYSIFGDLNQQGALTDANCGRSQNGRGGLFFVVKNRDLSSSIGDLIKGDSAPIE